MSRVLDADALGDCQAWQEPEVAVLREPGQPMTARQLEALHAQAREEGFNQGLEEGRQQGAVEIAERTRVLDSLLSSLARPFEELDDTVVQQVAQLATLVARQLVRRELRTDPQQVVGVVREALAALPLAAREVRLAVHPQDVVLVREALALNNEGQDIRIVEDPVQGRGGCRVISESSQIDATVESRLNNVIAHVLGGSRETDGENN